jgi:P4 family phage/plasmid primase-like protien
MRYPTNNPKRAAAWLHQYGANVLALDGKAPIGRWKEWQSVPQNTSDARSLPWGAATGVGILHGPGGWRCFDIDDCTTWAPIERLCDALGLPHSYRWIVQSGSGEGWHLWVRCPEDEAFPGKVERTPKREGAFDHLELRWANHQTAAPPSMHPSGRRYTFANGVPSSPPIELGADRVETALEAVSRPTRTNTGAPPKRRNRRTSTGDADVDEMREALSYIPPRPDYPEWIRVIAAVQDGAPDDHTAAELLREWSPEEKSGEYDRKLRSGLDRVTVATLFYKAMEHGYDSGGSDPPDPSGPSDFQPPSSTPSDPMHTAPHPADTSTDESTTFTVDDFRAALDGLNGRDAERTATDLLEKVATLSRADISRCRDVLEDHGARARRLRSWHSDAKAVKKELADQADAAQSTGPQDLEHGELTAWIAGRVQDEDHFALDRSGALYYYEGGRYRAGGERYLNQRIKAVLDEHGMTTEFSRYRCEEVRHRVETGAPRLWETPPDDRINLLNGILNLNTGEIEEHTPDWLSTRQVQIKHDPEAEGTAWRDFFASVLPEDASPQLGFELAAKLITPAFGRRKAYYLQGGPNTGKSTLIRNLIKGIIGEDGVTHITLQDLETDSFARADLFGRMLNVCADLPSEPLEGTSVFKQITGGDRMNAQRKYKDRFNFTPHCHLLFSGNGPIKAPQAGEAFWDRWVVIPFENEFSKGDDGYMPRDELDAALQDEEELSALLNEILSVLLEVRDDGVTVTDSMARALDAMRRDTDNQPPAHAGDGAQPKPSDTPDEAPEMQPAGVRHSETSTDRALDSENPRSQDFEKERDSDTGGTCPKKGAFQSSEREDEQVLRDVLKRYGSGMRVQTPDGPGEVKEIDHSGPRIVVMLDDDIATRPYAPEDVEPHEAPF